MRPLTIPIGDRIVEREVIGWREWVSLPELGIEFLDAKIDSGARSSSLDVHSIREFRRKNGRWVRFHVIDDNDLAMSGRCVEAPLTEYRDVRSSSGLISRRAVIQTTVILGDYRFAIDLTLTCRRSMGFRMLLGRTAIESRFLVDVSQSHLIHTA